MRDSEVNDVCACECPQPPTTIKDKVENLNMALEDCLGIVGQFSKFVWGEDLVVSEDFEVKSFDTAVEAALIKAKTLKAWLISVTTRTGM
jgi:hypothetical protein